MAHDTGSEFSLPGRRRHAEGMAALAWLSRNSGESGRAHTGVARAFFGLLVEIEAGLQKRAAAAMVGARGAPSCTREGACACPMSEHELTRRQQRRRERLTLVESWRGKRVADTREQQINQA